jgi:hypothetical protein
LPNIQEIASQVGFQGSSYQKSAEMPAETLAPIDNGAPMQMGQNISTSIDCYVAGTYVGKKGQRLEVTQRYQIFISYNKDTQAQTMVMVRNRISEDFNRKYGGNFNISAVFVPEFAAPPGEAEPEMFYGGRMAWAGRKSRYGTPIERASYEIGTEKTKYSLNSGSIRKRYGV